MWITRLIFILLGLWLFRQLWRLVTGQRTREATRVRKKDRPEVDNPFHDQSIREAEFEEVKDRREGSGDES